MSPSTTVTIVQPVQTTKHRKALTLIGLALLPELASRLNSRFATKLMEVFIGHDLTAHKLILEVGAVVR